MVRSVRQTPLGQIVTQTPCSTCHGQGHVIAHPCERCSGAGRRQTETRLTVTIPAGIDHGSRIRLSEKGEAGARGGPSGDLYVYVAVAPHALFRRDGRDTFVDIPVSFPQAALGAILQAPSLGGDVDITLPAGTQTGTTVRVRGAGMPSVRSSHRGDHHVTVHIVVPTKLNKRQREMLEAYAEVGGDTIDDRTFLERVKDAFRPE